MTKDNKIVQDIKEILSVLDKDEASLASGEVLWQNKALVYFNNLISVSIDDCDILTSQQNFEDKFTQFNEHMYSGVKAGFDSAKKVDKLLYDYRCNILNSNKASS